MMRWEQWRRQQGMVAPVWFCQRFVNIIEPQIETARLDFPGSTIHDHLQRIRLQLSKDVLLVQRARPFLKATKLCTRRFGKRFVCYDRHVKRCCNFAASSFLSTNFVQCDWKVLLCASRTNKRSKNPALLQLVVLTNSIKIDPMTVNA